MSDNNTDRTLNIFGRKGYEGIRCAVPADLPVPEFILAGTWNFETQYRRGELSPPSFVVPAAFRVTDVTGYYLFTDFQAEDGNSSRAL